MKENYSDDLHNWMDKPSPKGKLFKVISPDQQIWYGTFETRDEAEERMKNDYPKREYKIIEI